MQAIFSEEELVVLQSKIWWVACNITPYLVRSAAYETTLLISVTDLKNMWVTRIDKPTILKQKQKFARTLEVQNYHQLLALFIRILSNPESKALYQFYKKNENLSFKVEKQIEVYPFQWKFDLIYVSCNIAEMMCQDIINPLFRTLQAQQRRFQIMKKKMQILERDLLKKMSDGEKNNYRSVLKEDQQDLKLLVPQSKQQFIADLRFDSTTKMLFEKAMQITPVAHKASVQKMKQKVVKVEAKGAVYSEPRAQQLINQLQMKKQEQRQKKKKKAVDFL